MIEYILIYYNTLFQVGDSFQKNTNFKIMSGSQIQWQSRQYSTEREIVANQNWLSAERQIDRSSGSIQNQGNIKCHDRTNPHQESWYLAFTLWQRWFKSYPSPTLPICNRISIFFFFVFKCHDRLINYEHFPLNHLTT